MLRLFLACLTALALAPPARSAPLAEKYLLEGKHAEGEKALTKHLADKPDDDEARMGLAAIQLARAVEGVTKALYRHGLRSPELLQLMGLEMALPHKLVPNPKPEKLTHPGLRKIVQAWVDDLGKVEATLAKVKSDTVKLPVPIARVKLDLFGNGQSYSAVELVGLANLPRADKKEAAGVEAVKPAAARRKGQQDEKAPDEYLKKFVIAFDRGDAHWL